jgi:hypothetical protein
MPCFREKWWGVAAMVSGPINRNINAEEWEIVEKTEEN